MYYDTISDMRIDHPGQYRTQFVGKAGEHAVAAQFLLRGIPVHFPAVDTGADLIIGEKIRIQVKTRSIKQREGYAFCIAGGRPRNKHGVRDYTTRDWRKSADFIICWAVPENRFWIIPTADIKDEKLSILCLGFTPHWKYDHQQMRDLYQNGMNGYQIARHIGCSPHTVYAVLKGRIKDPEPSFSTHSYKYEGAWGLIDSALDLIRDVDSISGVNEFQVKEI